MSIKDTCFRRTEYSKNGCKECKRRKIKCDEFINPPPEAYSKINRQGRESCWQCTRLKKPCEYPLKGERVERVSRKKLMERSKEARSIDFSIESPSSNCSPSGLACFSPPSYTADPHGVPIPPPRATYPADIPKSLYFNPDLQRVPHQVPEHDFYRLSGDIVGQGGLMFPCDSNFDTCSSVLSSYSSSISSFVSNDNGWPVPYDSEDLNLLVNGLGNWVSEMGFEEDDLKIPSPEGILSEGMRLNQPRARSKSYSSIPRNVGICNFDVSPSEKIYLQEFYSGFADAILPFKAFDAASQSHFNPIRDVLLYCAYSKAYMLAAILAQGARSMFLKSGSPDDKFAYYKYMSECLELLRPNLSDQMSTKEGDTLPNVEAALLTALLLTSSSASNSKQNWRTHLRGAKDILLKHPISKKNLASSKLLLICKYWFISFETLAGLASKDGGTIESEEELDNLFTLPSRNEVQVLTNLGLVSHNGFFLLGGFHIELIPAWKDLIKLLNLKRSNPEFPRHDTVEYIRLFTIFERHTNVEFVNKKALLRDCDFQGGLVPMGLLLDPVAVDQDHIILSWMDLSQQLYCLAAIITVLTDFLGLAHESQQVQTFVTRSTSLLNFLSHYTEPPPLMKCAILMIQWPMRLAGINSVRESDRQLVLKFFDFAVKAGSGCAGYAMTRLKRMWKYYDPGDPEPLDDGKDIVYY